MKIAIIGQKGIPSRKGGVEIHVEEIAKRLVLNGNDVTVYCRKDYCESVYTNYEGINIKYIKSINTKHLDAITYTFSATIDAIKSKNEIIQYHALGPSLMSFLPRILGKKVVCTCHGLDWKREKWGKLSKIILKIGEFIGIKCSHGYIVVSNSLVEYFKNKYRCDVKYIPNGINIKPKVDANIIKNKFKLKKNEYILFVARLVPEKGAHYLIEAYKNIDTNKKLVIVGGGSHSNDYVDRLKNMTENNRNIIFTGFMDGEVLDELFYNAYFYVLPSDIEGLPISLLEAMAYGQCCLVSDIVENLEVIGEYGITFKRGNINDLKEKIKFLIKNESTVMKYKNNSEKYILKKYNWDQIANKTESLFNRISS